MEFNTLKTRLFLRTCPLGLLRTFTVFFRSLGPIGPRPDFSGKIDSFFSVAGPEVILRRATRLLSFTWKYLKFSYRKKLNSSRRWSWGLFLGNGIYLRLPGNYHKCPCKRMWKTLFIVVVNLICMCGNIKRYLWKK